MTCKDFSGKLFNSKDNEGNVVGSYLSNAEINGWVEAKIQLLAKLLWEPGRQHLLRTKSSLKRVEDLHISLPLLRKIQ